MAGTPRADIHAAGGLGIWAAHAVALLLANLRSRSLIDDDFVEQLDDALAKYEEDAPDGAEDAYDQVRYALSGDWMHPRGQPPIG